MSLAVCSEPLTSQDHRKCLYAVLLGIQGFTYVFQAGCRDAQRCLQGVTMQEIRDDMNLKGANYKCFWDVKGF